MQFLLKAFFFLSFLLPVIEYSFANGMSKQNEIILLLSERVCKNCDLRSLDLVHADLKNVDVTGSSLDGSNFGNAILDDSKFVNTDLKNVSFNGASLRNVDFTGAKIVATDFRNADLTNAKLDPNSLSLSYWDNAKGIDLDNLSLIELHNAGAESISRNLFNKAEDFFVLAVNKNKKDPNTLLALSYTQIQLGKFDLAIQNLDQASEIFSETNNSLMLEKINNLKDELMFIAPNKYPGNGIGSKLLSSMLTSFSIFAQPIFNIPNQFVISR